VWAKGIFVLLYVESQDLEDLGLDRLQRTDFCFIAGMEQGIVVVDVLVQ
jgi:uncharacterized protein YlbG (UPF0298 family)